MSKTTVTEFSSKTSSRRHKSLQNHYSSRKALQGSVGAHTGQRRQQRHAAVPQALQQMLLLLVSLRFFASSKNEQVRNYSRRWL
ncbi:hypothetical protein RPC_1040 [Rhodopseudomonas palustris BisB18]|uniref:Uncharacterized protein n=1 Tax=Rhodopseudomonas palustris (strain BisB18) TaxID=316056 RepID=Q21AI2_RHOPB